MYIYIYYTTYTYMCMYVTRTYYLWLAHTSSDLFERPLYIV